jgi:serine/threonine protein kinase
MYIYKILGRGVADFLSYRVESFEIHFFFQLDFLFGLENKSHLVHLIDFGLCKNYRHPLTYEHSIYRTGKTLTGTARYCSLYTHHGMEQSRRDDIECLSYIIIYLAKGSLPWMLVKISNRKKRNEKLTEIKESLTSKELCSNLPYEFELFYKYARTLSYTQRPDYGYLRNLLVAVISHLKQKFDYIYDWHLLVKMFKDNLDAGKSILPKKKMI